MAQDKDAGRETAAVRETTTVVMGRKLASAVRTIADRRNLTMAECWERYGGPGIYSELRQVISEMQADLTDPAFANTLTDAEAR